MIRLLQAAVSVGAGGGCRARFDADLRAALPLLGVAGYTDDSCHEVALPPGPCAQ